MFKSILQSTVDRKFVKEPHPYNHAAKAKDEDYPTWNKAVNGPNSEGYRQALI
jgi:hypothetical protein